MRPGHAMGRPDNDIDALPVYVQKLDHPNAAAVQHGAGTIGMFQARHQNAGRPPGQDGFDKGFFAYRIIVGNADHWLKAGIFQDHVHAGQHFRHDGIANRRDHDPDQPGCHRSQRAGNAVGDVIQVGGGFEDFLRVFAAKPTPGCEAPGKPCFRRPGRGGPRRSGLRFLPGRLWQRRRPCRQAMSYPDFHPHRETARLFPVVETKRCFAFCDRAFASPKVNSGNANDPDRTLKIANKRKHRQCGASAALSKNEIWLIHLKIPNAEADTFIARGLPSHSADMKDDTGLILDLEDEIV